MPNIATPWDTLRPQIEQFTTPFPEAAIAFADAHRDEVTPHLVEAIARVAADPTVGDDPDYVLHLYAMQLLATWRETAAYAPLVRLGHYPEAIVEQLLGDTVTESYGRCLASVCDGNLGPLQALAEDAAASHWARDAALTALTVRVLEGDASRDDLVDYLVRLGDAEATRLAALHGDFDDLQILNSVVSAAADIGASEMLERIQGWYASELVDATNVDLPWVERKIVRPYEACRNELLQRGKGYVTSVKREIGWWAGSGEEPARPPPIHLTQVQTPLRLGLKTGRNDPCPCGSGKKYKKCCGV
jgi:hypothetical protein